MIGSGANRYQLMDVDDLDAAIWSAMTYPKDKVATEFNIGAKEFTTMKEDYQAVLDRAGHGKKIRGMPVRPLVFILRILEKLHLSPLYPWVYETASTDSFVSIGRPSGSWTTVRATRTSRRLCATTTGTWRTSTNSRASRASPTECRGSKGFWPARSGSSKGACRTVLAARRKRKDGEDRA